jgi:hypothetical protein
MVHSFSWLYVVAILMSVTQVQCELRRTVAKSGKEELSRLETFSRPP